VHALYYILSEGLEVNLDSLEQGNYFDYDLSETNNTCNSFPPLCFCWGVYVMDVKPTKLVGLWSCAVALRPTIVSFRTQVSATFFVLESKFVTLLVQLPNGKVI
jgi:hypothetical protein